MEILYRVIFFLSVAFIAGFPSGTFMQFPLKFVFSFFLLLLFVVYFIKGKIYTTMSFFVSITAFAIFLFVYFLIGYLRFGVFALKEFELMFVTFLLFVIVYLLVVNVFSLSCFSSLLKFTILTSFFIKLLAIVFVYNHPDVDSIKRFFLVYFNTRVVTMKLYDSLYRIYLPTDILASFYPWMAGWLRKHGLSDSTKRVELFFLFISFFIVAVGFSRYLIVVFLAGSVYMLKSFEFNWKPAVLLAGIMSVIFRKSLFDFVRLRFFSRATVASDAVRIKQFPALVKLFLMNPVVGWGIGAFSFDYVRSWENSFSYEEQILSFYAKFGLMGMLFLIFIVVAIIAFLLIKKDYVAALVFVLFIMAGWFNPYLYSSTVFLLYVFAAITVKYYGLNKEELCRLNS